MEITTERRGAHGGIDRVRNARRELDVDHRRGPVALDALGLLGMAALGSTIARSLGGAIAGAVAGLGAGVAMNQLHRAWTAVEKNIVTTRADAPGSVHPHGARAGSGAADAPATVKAAEAIVGPVSPASKNRAGTIVHYAMAGVTGAIYGAATDLFAAGNPYRGLGYGAIVWLAADELAVPALGLAPWRAPARTHARALIAHLVYGFTLDVGIRAVRRTASLMTNAWLRRRYVRRARAWVRT
jgi:putative membrane protein